MSRPVLYPYETLSDGEPALAVTGLRIDGKPRPDWLRKDEATAALFEQPGPWARAELDLEVTFPAAGVAAFEKAHGAVAVVAVAHCQPTNGREQVRLKRAGTDAGRWSGTLELDRDNYRGRAKLEATFTATVSGVGHRPVAVTNPWAAYFDEPESFRWGKCLPVKWHDFARADAPPVARDFPTATHAVDFGGALPTLYLNSGFAGLEALLKDRKDRKGPERAIHDLLRTGIARSVWLTLLRDALADLRPPGGGENPAADWPETPWRAEVLRHVLPEVAPGKSDAELLVMAATEWQEPGLAGDLFARAEAVVGDMVSANEVVRRFVQKLPEEAIG